MPVAHNTQLQLIWDLYLPTFIIAVVFYVCRFVIVVIATKFLLHII